VNVSSDLDSRYELDRSDSAQGLAVYSSTEE
jgi:hypothetical protein